MAENTAKAIHGASKRYDRFSRPYGLRPMGMVHSKAPMVRGTLNARQRISDVPTRKNKANICVKGDASKVVGPKKKT